jgi:hypothetical protein
MLGAEYSMVRGSDSGVQSTNLNQSRSEHGTFDSLGEEQEKQEAQEQE